MLIPQVDDEILYNNTKLETVLVPLQLPAGHLRRILWQNPGPFEDSNPLNPRIFSKLLKVSSLFNGACQVVASQHRLLHALRNENFDVGLVEQYDSCGFGHKFHPN